MGDGPGPGPEVSPRLPDRRFDRSAYDARQLVEAFAGRLRDRVDLDEVTGELTTASERAFHPAAAAIWVRDRAGE